MFRFVNKMIPVGFHFLKLVKLLCKVSEAALIIEWEKLFLNVVHLLLILVFKFNLNIVT